MSARRGAYLGRHLAVFACIMNMDSQHGARLVQLSLDKAWKGRGAHGVHMTEKGLTRRA